MQDPDSAPSGAPQPPAAPTTPPAATESPTEPFIPTFAPPATQAPAQPNWSQPVGAAAPQPPLAPFPPAFGGGRSTFAAPEPGGSTSKARAARRPGGTGMIVAAVLATAVIASGGTAVALTAAGVGGTTATQPPFTPAAAGSGAQASQAPAANGAQPPVAGVQPTPPPATSGTNGQSPAATVAPLAPGAQANVVDIVKAVSPAVVTIVADGVTETDPTTGMSGSGTATGSGVIFDANGLILTNHHVVSGNPSRLTVNLKDGRSFDATIYGVDTLTDLAIVKVDATGLPTAPIGDSSTIQVGQQAIAIGSPLGQFTDSVTSGIISAIGRSIPVDQTTVLSNLIQTDTAINPGNSGGPLLDPTGSVIGINTAVAGDSQGIGFAIPINVARPLLAQASAGQALARPWLGIRFLTIDPTVKSEAGLAVDDGAWIPSAEALRGQGGTGTGSNGLAPADPTAVDDSVVAGGPAAQAGLQPGDIITAVDGTALDATHPLDMVMSQHAPGDTVTLDVLRGQTVQVQVTLGTRPATS
jgi:S1-C subfamily serine protease